MNSREPWAHLVTESRLLALHAASMGRHGGRVGPPKPGCIDGSLGAAWSAEGYQQDEAGIEGLIFAGFALFYLAKNHCFVDGNKRAAWIAAVEILATLGLAIGATTAECYDLMDAVARGDVERPEACVRWLAEHLVELQ